MWEFDFQQEVAFIFDVILSNIEYLLWEAELVDGWCIDTEWVDSERCNTVIIQVSSNDGLSQDEIICDCMTPQAAFCPCIDNIKYDYQSSHTLSLIQTDIKVFGILSIYLCHVAIHHHTDVVYVVDILANSCYQSVVPNNGMILLFVLGISLLFSPLIETPSSRQIRPTYILMFLY